MKTPFKEHIEALVRDKVPQEKGDSKSVVAEFQKKPISFSLQKLTTSAFQTVVYLETLTEAKPIIYFRIHILRIPILKKYYYDFPNEAES